MSMVTKCPACNTLFRVTPQQLQAQRGQVRCGQCMTVFDGLGEMTSTPAPAAARVPPATAREQGPAAPAPVTKPAQAIEIESPPTFPEFTLEPLAAQEVVAAEPLQNPVEPNVSPTAAAMPPPLHADEMDVPEAYPEPPRRSRLWAVGSVLALLTLAGQAAYFYRTELAANYPGLKPVMMQACEALGCVVPLPQRPKLISVEASDLQAIDPAQPHVIQLTATLRNQAKYDLGYPALDLVLTNSKDHTLARRIFKPAEYLERGRDVRAGLAANAEITIRLSLDTGTLGAAGFRLDLLPGPAH
ncbi:MAG: zinc-ribbon and DUF3426 domain-containing protein [Burkholderiales bacterium]|nr:zinc-ribbon and DUF3426 domain-containing protein [Burkholderiales bacterium]